MKQLKIFMLMVMASLAFAACSDDDESWNTNSGVVVSMKNSEITWKENKGSNTPVSVPITVTGERNGLVQVTVSVAETGANPAMDDVHYIVTSKTIVIPADADEGSIELRTIDDADINEDRTFTMTITGVQGATIGGEAVATITLKDNDSEFYEKLFGAWTMTAVNWAGSTAYSWNVSIDGYEEGENGYNQYLWISGLMGYAWCYADLEYFFDTTTKEGHVDFIFPSLAAEGVGFTGLGDCDVYLYRRVGNSLSTASIEGKWNDDFTEIVFEKTFDTEEPTGIYASVIPQGTDESAGAWFQLRQIKLTKK